MILVQKLKGIRGVTAILVFLLAHYSPSWAQSADNAPSVDTSAPSVQVLDQKVRILQRHLELRDEEAKAVAAETPQITAGPYGFILKSPEGDFDLEMGGLLQADYRDFLSGNDTANQRTYLGRYPNNFPSTFLLRRVRPIWEGSLWKYYGFRIMPDFGGGTTVLLDAYADVNLLPELRLKAGKFTPPIGLERLQTAPYNSFVELGYPTSLVPLRDLGVQLFGDFMNGSYNYAIGVFNGAVDGASKDADSTTHKDITGRIFVQPFKNGSVKFLRDLGLGFAANWGQFWGDSVNTNLSTYKTTGQNTFFSFRTGSKDSLAAHAHGDHYRFNPEGYWYAGSAGLLGEYVSETQKVQVYKTREANLTNQAWLATATFVVTGENPSYSGVKPRHPLAMNNSGFGAVELVAHAGQLILDRHAFPFYADSTKSARQATSFGGGINWYLSNSVKWVLGCELTQFKGGSVIGNRNDEDVAVSRLQVNF